MNLKEKKNVHHRGMASLQFVIYSDPIYNLLFVAVGGFEIEERLSPPRHRCGITSLSTKWQIVTEFSGFNL